MIVVAVLSFIAVFVLTLAIYFWFRERIESPTAELKRRLRRMATEAGTTASMPDDVRVELLKGTPFYEKVVNRIPIYQYLCTMLERSGLQISLEKFSGISLLAVVLGFAVAFLLTRSAVFALIVMAFLFVAPVVYLQYLIIKRLDKFTEQLPEALTMLARSLRAGHSLTSAFELIGNEMSDPLGGLFKTAYDQQRFGLRIQEALSNMLLRIESLDLRFFVMLVSINAEIGGNLSETLDKLAATIRERLKLRRQVRVLTAQGRLSGYILAALPIVTFVALQYLLMPGYEDVFLHDKKGQQLIVLALAGQVIGYLIIRKIVNVRV